MRDNLERLIRMRFKTKQDVDHFWVETKIMGHVSAVVKASGTTLSVKFKDGPTVILSDINLLTETLKINGHLVDLKAAGSLQEFESKISAILKETASFKQPGLYDWLISDANANPAILVSVLEAVVIGAAVGFVLESLRIVLKNDRTEEAKKRVDGFDPILQECENRDDSIPYEQSKAFQKLKAFEIRYDTKAFGAPVQDCEGYSREKDAGFPAWLVYRNATTWLDSRLPSSVRASSQCLLSSLVNIGKARSLAGRRRENLVKPNAPTPESFANQHSNFSQTRNLQTCIGKIIHLLFCLPIDFESDFYPLRCMSKWRSRLLGKVCLSCELEPVALDEAKHLARLRRSRRIGRR